MDNVSIRRSNFRNSKYRLFISCCVLLLSNLSLNVQPLFSQRTIETQAGASLRLYSPEDGIPSNQPTNAFVADDGYLWISTTGGTVRISGNEIEDFGIEYGIPLMQYAYFDRRQNTIWYTDDRSLIRFDGSSVTRFDGTDGFTPPGGVRKEVRAMLADSRDRLWMGSYTIPFDTPHNGGLILFDNEQFHTFSYDELPLHNIGGLYEASDGTVWITSFGYRDGGFNNSYSYVARYKDDAFEIFDTPDGCLNVYMTFREPNGVTPEIIEDKHGNLWFHCTGAINYATNERFGNGLFRFNGERFEEIGWVKDKLYDDLQIYNIFYHKEKDELYVSFNRQTGMSAEESESITVFRNGNWEKDVVVDARDLEGLAAQISEIAEILYWGYYYTMMQDGTLLANLQVVERATQRFYGIIFKKDENEWKWIDTFPGIVLMDLPGNVLLTGHSDPDVIGIYTPPFSRLITADDGLLKSPDEGGQFFTDHEGNVWLTYLNSWDNDTGLWNAVGLSMWDGERIHNFTTDDGLSGNHVFRPLQDSNGTLWFPSDGGVTRVTKTGDDYHIVAIYGPDGQQFRSTHIVERTNGEIFTYASDVLPGTDTHPGYAFFLGSYNGEYFDPYDLPYPDSLLALPYHMYQLTADRENRLWLIAGFSQQEGDLYSAPSHIRVLVEDEWIDPTDEWGIPETRLYYVGELQTGRYFIVDGGFYEFDGNRFIDLTDSVSVNMDFRILQRVNPLSMAFHIEGNEHLYIRFRDMGIAVYDGIRLAYLDRRNGLPSLRLLYPNRDRNGDILFTTPTGGIIFNGFNFTSIQDNAVTDGSPRAIARDKNDAVLILYQGIGFTVTGMDTTRYPVRLASIKADTIRFFEGQHARLKANQNNIGFRFATMNFTIPDEVQFTYFLEGFDNEWSRPSTLHFTEYRNLPSGNYTFYVRSISPGNVVSDDAVFSFSIAPPWWRTWWAYVFYAILFGVGLVVTDRLQRRRLHKKELERTRERELRQAREIGKAYRELEKAHENLKAAQQQLVQQEKLASLGQLTAGIAHEIKNPLNFVNNFSEVSMELIEEAREEVEKQQGAGGDGKSDVLFILSDIETNLKKIHEHGSRADRIVKSMLQHSRGGSGRKDPTDVNALVKEYVNLAFHGMRAGKDPINVDIVLDLNESVGMHPLIVDDFSRVLLNLCNNAFDAMRTKVGTDGYAPQLTIRTRREGKHIHLEVEDNGPGIPEVIKDKILQPFFTTKKGTEGTGLGLSITHDIVKAHGGSIHIESEYGTRTVCKITL
jgi:signal transduction histidine kinase